jgi:hypothetical protein
MTTRTILVNYDFEGVSRLLGLPDAISDQEPATLAQVKAYVEGLAWKDSVRVRTQGNINLAAPGPTIDGITMAIGDRYLSGSQTAAPQNGIYIWTGAATPSTRALDASTFAELEAAVVVVEEGTDAGTIWRQTQVNGVLGTNNVLWEALPFSAPLASTTTPGRIQIAVQPDVDLGLDNSKAVTSATLKNWAGGPKRYGALIGDNSATQWTITHNLNTRGLNIKVYRNSGNYDEVECGKRDTTVNSVTLIFTRPPLSNEFAVVLNG